MDWLLPLIAALLSTVIGVSAPADNRLIFESRPPITVDMLDIVGDKGREWLINQWDNETFGIRPKLSNLRQSTLIYEEGGQIRVRTLWPLAPDVLPSGKTTFDRIFSFSVYPQRDTLGRSYIVMTLPPSTDFYVDGLLIVRWDAGRVSVVLLESEYCTGGDWHVREDGALVIPTARVFPNQGLHDQSE